MKTAVEWFYQRILANDIKEVFEQAKEMEKQQIIEANQRGIELGWLDAVNEFKNNKGMINKSTIELAEQYYNETFDK